MRETEFFEILCGTNSLENKELYKGTVKERGIQEISI